jgi:hypothetical protein
MKNTATAISVRKIINICTIINASNTGYLINLMTDFFKQTRFTVEDYVIEKMNFPDPQADWCTTICITRI